MKRHKTKTTIAIACSLLFFFILSFVVNGNNPVNSSLIVLVGLNAMENQIIVEGAILLISGVVFTIIYQLLHNRISILFIKACMLLYAILLLVIVMLKSPGVRAINIDLLDLYRSIIEYPASVLINLLLFIPLGAIAFRYSKSMAKAFGLALVFIIFLESMQYVLRLGITDIVDVVINMIGFSIGYLLLSILRDSGLRLTYEGSNHLKVVRLSNKATTEDSEEALYKEKLRKKDQIPVYFLAFLLIMLIVGFFLYDYEPYNFKAPTQIAADETLNNMPEKSYRPEEIADLIKSITLFKVDDCESSNDWLGVDGEGMLYANGIVSNYSTWITEEGVQCFGLSFGVQEEAGGIVVTHGIPLIVTPKTKVLLTGELIGFDEFAENVIPYFFQYSLEAKFSMQNGWLRAEELVFQAINQPQNIPFVWFDYTDFTQNTKNATAFPDRYFFEVYTSKSSLIEGKLDVLSQDIDTGNYITLRIEDKIGSALICHTVDIKLSNEIPKIVSDCLSEDKSIISLEVHVVGEHLTYKE